MKTTLAGVLVFLQLLEAGAEVTFQRLITNETLHLSCSPPRERGSPPTGLQLYHRSAHGQTTLLSVAEGGGVTVDPGNQWRLRLSGGLRSRRLNVTLSHLGPGDTGLYVWELSHRDNGSVSFGSSQRVFLLVDGEETTCQCSPSYPALLLTISMATSLLLLTLAGMAVHKCAKARHQTGGQTLTPIYEEMTRKQPVTGTAAENSQDRPAHLEEADFPLYANPNIRQSQDNYYACPRQLALKA